MAKRRSTIDDGSLELLLDTITNAFGGILFIAILVVVLLKGTGRKMSSSQDAKVDTAALSEQLRELEAKLSAVDIEIQATETITENLADLDLRSTLTTLQQQRKQRNALIDERSRRLQQLTQSQAQLADLVSKSEMLTQNTASEARSLEALQSNLDQERAKRKIKSPFPEERAASKSDYSVTIRYGRWYVDRTPAGVPNLDDFAVLDTDGEYVTITPKPYRGIPIVENKVISPRIVSSLRSKNPRADYVCISIWDDSYKEFQFVRDFLVENGFEYRLIAVTDGDEVAEGYVPNPQVQ